eukprot:COSAG04_NODE_16925_length_485_cov_0.797927_1_plen_62_part_00
MTLEGEALAALAEAAAGSAEAVRLAEEAEGYRLAKEAGNAELQLISDEYKDKMAAIRAASE